jgi:HEAT repeat protein
LKDPYLHSSVSGALRNVGSSALEPLIAALKEQDPNVRIGAASALGALKNPRAIPPLAAALNDPDLSVGKSAASALGEFGAAAVEPLIAAVADPAVRVKRDVAGALGGIQNPRAVRFLLAAAKAPDLEVVAGAWFFYLDRKAPGSEGVLMQALEAFGGKNMAEGFVNSRNHLLEEAGLRWGRAQGYSLMTFGDPGSHGASVSKWK